MDSIQHEGDLATNDPLFEDIDADDPKRQVCEVESLCLNCNRNGTTRMLLAKIPNHQEIIVSSFECCHCGHKNNDTQFGGRFQEKGVRIELHVKHPQDLNRNVVKSDFAKVIIPELEFEISSQSQKGDITTVEGILDRVMSNLSREQPTWQKTDPETAVKIGQFVLKLSNCRTLQSSFHLIVDDPSGNSMVENLYAPRNDPQMKWTFYKRSLEDNQKLGISQDQDNDPSPDLEIATFLTNCHLCNSPCETNMKPTNIPHFKQVIIMATNCDVCGHRSSEVKSGAAIEPLGTRIELQVQTVEDLKRDVLKSETCEINIPDLELESGASALGGRFTTVEGLLESIGLQLRQCHAMSLGDSSQTHHKQKMNSFLENLDQARLGNKKIKLILDDPAGNSYIQSTEEDDQFDSKLRITRYERSFEQNEELGLNQMKTENYEEA